MKKESVKSRKIAVVIVILCVLCLLGLIFYINRENDNSGVDVLTESNIQNYAKLTGEDISGYVTGDERNYRLDSFSLDKLNKQAGEKKFQWGNILSLKSADEVKNLPGLYIRNNAVLLIADENQELWKADLQYQSDVRIEFDVIRTDGKEEPVTPAIGIWEDEILKIMQLPEWNFRLEEGRYLINIPTTVGEEVYYAIINDTGQDIILADGIFRFPSE